MLMLLPLCSADAGAHQAVQPHPHTASLLWQLWRNSLCCCPPPTNLHRQLRWCASQQKIADRKSKMLPVELDDLRDVSGASSSRSA
jgi:hypothetical protein